MTGNSTFVSFSREKYELLSIIIYCIICICCLNPKQTGFYIFAILHKRATIFQNVALAMLILFTD